MAKEGIPSLPENELAVGNALPEAQPKESSRARRFGSMRVLTRSSGLAILTLLWVAACSVAQAEQSVSLAWDPSPDTNVTGYAVYYGNVSGTYGSRVDTGSNMTATIPGLSEGRTYYFAAVAYDAQGIESEPSNEVSFRPVAGSRHILGRVVWAGQPVIGAHVSATFGTSLFEGWTDTNGLYNLTGLGSTNSYSISCTATGLTFSPQFTNPVSLPFGDAYGQDFYANELLPPSGSMTLYTVSGQVTDASAGVAGAEVRGGGMVTTTDASGNYKFTNFVNGTYTLVARKDSWTFSPATRTVSVSSANSTGNNFSRAAPYSISGTFTGLPAASQSPAPTVYLSNGRSVQATRQGSGANRFWGYTLPSVPTGQYSISAELSGYSITGSGFTNPLSVAANLTGVNFTGLAATVAGAISGRILQQSTPLAGVGVQANLGGSSVASTTSDSDGYYRIANLGSGSYSIAPSKTGYTFSPASLSVSAVPSSGNNFSATGPASSVAISLLTASPAVVAGTAATTTLSVVATGSGTLTYSWDTLVAAGPVTFSTNDSSGATSTTVSFQLPGNYTFRAKVTDGNGLFTTTTVNVTVNSSAGSLVVAPYQVQVAGGQTVVFRADAWDQLGNRISVSPTWSVSGGGSIGSSGGLYSASTAGGPYSVTAVAGTLSATGFVWVTSSSTNLTPPSITTQPLSQSITQGGNVAFTVVAGGTQPLNYQWLLNGGPISGATASSYSRTNLQVADAGNYSVQVTNGAGSITSSNAVLSVIVPPSITAQPASQTVALSSNVTFSVVASGTGPLSYQWLFNGGPIGGATATSYTRTNVQSGDAGNYSVQVTNTAGLVTSSNASLVVIVPPAITTQPTSQAIPLSSNVTFSVVASGTGPLSYQWLFNGGPIGGATATSYTRTNVQSADAGNYSVRVTNTVGLVTSSNASLTVIVPPAITAQPASQTVALSSNVTFSVVANGTGPLNYQWLFNGGPIGGATASSYTRTNIQLADGGNYSVAVTNAAGAATSSNAVLAVVAPPAITTQPLSQAVAAGANVIMSVVVTGTAPFSYQWKLGGSDIPGAVTNSYSLTNVQSIDAGSYTVLITNSAGSVTSAPAILAVNNAPWLAPISDQTIHAGATVTITNTAVDIDVPSQTLAFSLDPGAPSGATIGSASGIFAWSTDSAQPASSNAVTVRVTDNGTPSLSFARSFQITVVAPLTVSSITASNGSITIFWSAIPGKTYRVQYKGSLSDSAWNALSPDVRAEGTTASQVDPAGASQRFYRVLSVD